MRSNDAPVRPHAASGGALVLALMCIVALNLRSVSVGVSPVLPLIRGEFAVNYALAGVLFALPIAMMGLWAEPGRRLVDRWGPWRAIAVSLALIALGGGLRALAPNYALMLGLTGVFGAGIGLAQPSLPRLVAERFTSRRAFATGVYSAGLTGGAVLGALLTPLLLPTLGDVGWRGTCLVWAGFAALSLAGWVALGPRSSPPAATSEETARAARTPPAQPPLHASDQAPPDGTSSLTASVAPSPAAAPFPAVADGPQDTGPTNSPGVDSRRLAPPSPAVPVQSVEPTKAGPAADVSSTSSPIWRDRVAWLITLLFLLQSMGFYQLVGWLPSYYLELGLGLDATTLAFTMLNLSSLPCGLLASYFSDRVHKRRPFVAVGALLLLAGMVGLLMTPLHPAWLWPALAGGGIGIVFTMALALPTDLLDPRRAGPTVSLVFTVGYGAALVSPLLAGVIRDATGSFVLALLPTVATALAMLATTFALPETARGLRGPIGSPKR